MFVVTGANGFIGSAMIWELNKRGLTDILAVDRVDQKSRPDILSHLKFTQFQAADKFLNFLKSNDSRNIRAVFHMGACSSTTEMNLDFLREVNTDYTKKVALAAMAQGWPLIYASSGAVYGDGQAGFNDEGSSRRFHPLNPYGWSKAHFDVWIEEQPQKPDRWYGLRFFNVFGPNEYHKGEMSSVVYKAFQQISKSNRLRLFRSHNPNYRDGEQLRDFVYVKDITRWMFEIYQNPRAQSGIYNMGFGKARTWLDLARAVFKEMNRELLIDWIDIPENIRNQYQYFTEAKMDRLLGLGLSAPAWSLERGVEDYIKNYLLQPEPHLR